MANPTPSNHKRLAILFYVACGLFLVLILNIAKLTLIDAADLQEEAENQWTREVAVSPERGSILDKNGKVLAQSATAQSVLLYPKDIAESKDIDAREVADTLAEILDMDPEEVYEKASDTSKVEIWLKRQITQEQVDAIRAANLPGVDFFTDTKRYYPMNDFMSQVIGYTNADGEGQEGLEKEYEKYLAGYEGTKLVQVDANGRTISGSEQMYIEPQPGLNVVLTSDYIIQSFLESAAREAMEVNDAKGIVGIVMDPNDGAILGMVNYPEADLNNLDRSDLTQLAELSKNKAIVDAYEPGSTFKIITTAAALDSGAATLESHFNCPGYKIVDGEKIKCWRSGNPHGDQTLMEAVSNSCNPAFMEMALAMTADTFYEYIYAFGFGQTTGVDYSADAAGIVRDKKYVKNVDLARIGFGQSIAVTPLQLATAVSAVINGGTLYEPRLVSHLEDQEGNIVEEFEATAVRQVISEDTSEKMRAILENVVANGGGKNAQIEGYRVGGKTGTAQLYEDGKIAEGKNISSFIGFAPADDPQFLVLFVVYEPGVPVTFGSVVAAPFVKDILEKCLKYADIPPTEETGEETLVSVPNFVGKTVEEAREAAEQAGVTLEIEGTGTVKNQSPLSGEKVIEGSVIGLVCEQTSEVEKVPNIVGKTVAQAYETLRSVGLELKIEGESGTGVIVSQQPAANEPVEESRVVTVTCESREKKPEDET